MANGVPSLLNQTASVTNTISLMSSDAQGVAKKFSTPQWGVYLNGSLALSPDTIIGFDFKKDWRLPTYPMESGSFQTYNKVTMPYDARVIMTKGGSTQDRRQFLTAALNAADSTNLYSILTPEITFTSSNICHIDFRRTSANGVSLLTVELWFQQIRNTATSQSSTSKDASGASQTNTGTVQTTTPTTFQQSQITSALKKEYGF